MNFQKFKSKSKTIHYHFNLKFLLLITMVVFCAGAGLFAVNVGTASATDYYVSTSGDNSDTGLSTDHAWATIQHAADTVGPGDTVLVQSGTYNENVVETTSGTADNRIVYQGVSNPVIDAGGGTGFKIQGDYVTVTEFYVKNANYGIWIFKSNYVNVSYNTMDDFSCSKGISIYGESGSATNLLYPTVEHNIINSQCHAIVLAYGIWGGSVSYNNLDASNNGCGTLFFGGVASNGSQDPPAYGWFYYMDFIGNTIRGGRNGFAGGVIYRCYIADNNISGHFHNCMNLHSTIHSVIENNWLGAGDPESTDSPNALFGDGSTSHWHDNVFRNNHVEYADNNAFKLGNGWNFVVEGLIIDHSGGHGILFTEGFWDGIVASGNGKFKDISINTQALSAVRWASDRIGDKYGDFWFTNININGPNLISGWTFSGSTVDETAHILNTNDARTWWISGASAGEFRFYYPLDVNVTDANGNPIEGATVTITNDVDSNYPSINYNWGNKTTFTTGADGHTRLPSDEENSVAIMDFRDTSAGKTYMSHTITAEKNSYSNSTTVNPDSSWYRSNPDTYQNTVTIVLNIGTSDTTPPTIISHLPSGIDVAVNTNISVNFSEAMNQTLAQNAFSISPNVSGSFAWNSNQMIFNPSSDLSNNTTYTMTINTLAEDLAGNNLQSPYAWNFTTIAETPPDTTPPICSNSSPTGTLSYGTTQTTLSLTTDENSTCKYSTTPNTNYSSMPNTFFSTGTTSHSTTVLGLSNGNTYIHYVKCMDFLNNPNTNDYSITFSIASEPQAGDLVAHWKFDHGSGTIAIDSSGNNNGTLTNMDPATDWVDGKIGNALDFDGADDYVNCGNSSILAINEPITIEAWIYPHTTPPSEDHYMIFRKNGDNNEKPYMLAVGTWAASDTYLLFTFNNGSWIEHHSNTQLSLNQWQHVAATYDGSNMRFYINGVSDGVAAETANMATENHGAAIATNFHDGAAKNSYFDGSIDDVRIYSRALTAAEVLAHYNEGNEPEINHDPIGSLDTANQSSITGWAYDQNSDSNPIDVHIYIDGNLIGSSTANLNRPDLVSAGVCPDPNHGFSFTTPSLSIGDHTVSVYAINQPEATNPELIGSPITFTVSSSDTAPPTGSIQINSGNEKTNSQTVSLSISANDDSGLSKMKISETNDFSSAAAEVYNTVKSFILSPIDGLKTVYIWFKDTIGNWNITPYSDTIILDSTSPTISNISVSNITTNTALITFQTNEDSYSYLEYGTSVAYGFQLPANSELKTDYSISITGLGSNTEYHFRVVSKDELENESNSIDQTFKTIGNPDTIPPSKITDLSSSNITQTSADLLWTSPGDDNNTGTASTYDIRYSTSNITESNWNSATQISGEPIPQSAGTEQSIYIAVGLSSNTNYYFAIKTSDEVPNVSDISNILSLKTLSETIPPPPSSGGGTVSDTTPPSQPINFTATPADSQIFLTWTNPTDSDFVRVKVLRKENSSPTSHNDSLAKIVYEGNKQQYTDINLNNNTTYYYSIFAYDKKPNYSKILTISSKPEKGKTSIEIPNGSSYPEGTLLKTPDSFKIYIIINQKKKWIPTPEVFETLGYQWTEIIEIDKNELILIPDYEDNLIRAINDFKVYLIVNGIKRHIPNPEIFLNYGFEWNEVKDVNLETINQYTQANLIKESKKEEIYYLCPERKIKRWLRSPEIFNSYPDNNWNNIQVISKYEMDHYPESNLIKLIGDNNVYLIENNRKRLINSVEEFKREGLDWNLIMGVGGVEWEWFKG